MVGANNTTELCRPPTSAQSFSVKKCKRHWTVSESVASNNAGRLSAIIGMYLMLELFIVIFSPSWTLCLESYLNGKVPSYRRYILASFHPNVGRLNVAVSPSRSNLIFIFYCFWVPCGHVLVQVTSVTQNYTPRNKSNAIVKLQFVMFHSYFFFNGSHSPTCTRYVNSPKTSCRGYLAGVAGDDSNKGLKYNNFLQ